MDYLNSEFGAQRFPQCVQKCESDVNKMKLKDIIPEKRCKELKVRYMDPMCPIYIYGNKVIQMLYNMYNTYTQYLAQISFQWSNKLNKK